MRSLSGRMLGNPLLNWIGLRSYGLYLFHWPIYQFIRKEAGIGLTGAEFAIAMVFTFTIAELSLPLRRDADPHRSCRRLDPHRTCAGARPPPPRCGGVARWPSACW